GFSEVSALAFAHILALRPIIGLKTHIPDAEQFIASPSNDYYYYIRSNKYKVAAQGTRPVVLPSLLHQRSNQMSALLWAQGNPESYAGCRIRSDDGPTDGAVKFNSTLRCC